MTAVYDHTGFDHLLPADATIPNYPSTAVELASAPMLLICDADLYVVAPLKKYSSLTFTPRFRGGSSWSITVPRRHPNANLLLRGRVLLYRNPAESPLTYPLVIKQVHVDDDGEIEISGMDYASTLFERRYILAGTLPGSGEYSETGLADTAMRSLIGKNVINASRAVLQDPLIHLETQIEPIRGLDVTVPIKYDLSLLDAIEACCLAGDIGWEGVVVEDDTVPHGWSIEIRCLPGHDRSETNTGDAW